MLDMVMPPRAGDRKPWKQGLDVLKHVRDLGVMAPVLMMTGGWDTGKEAEALIEGAIGTTSSLSPSGPALVRLAVDLTRSLSAQRYLIVTVWHSIQRWSALPRAFPHRFPRLIHAPMSPRRTPAETTATAKPTRAKPSRSRSVMSNLPSIVPREHPHRRHGQLPDLPVADLPGAYYSAVACRLNGS